MMPLCISLSHTAVQSFGFAPVDLKLGNSVCLGEETESHVENEIFAHLETVHSPSPYELKCLLEFKYSSVPFDDSKNKTIYASEMGLS
jgi:hypothetical protein